MDWKFLAISATSISAAFVFLNGAIGFTGLGVVIYELYQYEKEQDLERKNSGIMD